MATRTFLAALAALVVLCMGGSFAGAQEPDPDPTTTTEPPPETTTTTEPTPETTTTTEPPPELKAPIWSEGLEGRDFRIGAALVGVTLGVVVGGAVTGRRY